MAYQGVQWVLQFMWQRSIDQSQEGLLSFNFIIKHLVWNINDLQKNFILLLLVSETWNFLDLKVHEFHNSALITIIHNSIYFIIEIVLGFTENKSKWARSFALETGTLRIGTTFPWRFRSFAFPETTFINIFYVIGVLLVTSVQFKHFDVH